MAQPKRMIRNAMPGCIRSPKTIYNGTRIPRAPTRVVRAVYEEHFGPVPEGHHLHHLCGNGWCVAPDHLAALSKADHLLTHRYCGLPFGFNETAFAAG